MAFEFGLVDGEFLLQWRRERLIAEGAAAYRPVGVGRSIQRAGSSHQRQ
jgi:hypothetical protein